MQHPVLFWTSCLFDSDSVLRAELRVVLLWKSVQDLGGVVPVVFVSRWLCRHASSIRFT